MRGRQCGLDLYRSMAILMITILHVNFQHCGLICAPDLPKGVYGTGLFIEYLCYAGVNCFALLSGYLAGGMGSGYDLNWLRKIGSFWLKMVLWGVVLYSFVVLFLPGAENFVFDLRANLLPFSGYYWYINAYFALMLLMPFMNKALESSSEKSLLILSVALFVFSSVFPAFGLESEQWSFDGGYSTGWLAVCFIYGGVIKRMAQRILQIRKIKFILTVLSILSVVVPFVCDFAGWRGMLFYNSPFCILEAVCLLLLFIRIEFRSGWLAKAVSFASVNALGVYLFQNHPFIWNNYVFRENPEIYSGMKMVGYFFLVVLILEAVGMTFNYIVDKIFNGIKKIKKTPLSNMRKL